MRLRLSFQIRRLGSFCTYFDRVNLSSPSVTRPLAAKSRTVSLILAPNGLVTRPLGHPSFWVYFTRRDGTALTVITKFILHSRPPRSRPDPASRPLPPPTHPTCIQRRL